MAQKQPLSRVLRSKQEARASYDRLSRWYDWLSGPYERRWSQAALAGLAVQPGETVLEIGCGTGQALLALAHSAGPAGWVCGLDLSTGMLQVARERLQSAGLGEPGGALSAGGRPFHPAAPSSALLCADAARLPLAAQAFDVLFMSFTLELFDSPEIPQVLGECRRVLRPGGRVGVVGMSKGTGGLAVALYERLHQAWPRVVDCRPIYVSAALAAAGFATDQAQAFVMFGLPGERVIGHKQEG